MNAAARIAGRLAAWWRARRVPSPAWGCVGCGARRSDVRTFPAPGALRGEGYCWACVAELRIPADEYRAWEPAVGSVR